ncbi:MAG: hypothetical protein AAGA80_22360 [Cyanobacteria bacterium P01_F01_bin.143]
MNTVFPPLFSKLALILDSHIISIERPRERKRERDRLAPRLARSHPGRIVSHQRDR